MLLTNESLGFLVCLFSLLLPRLKIHKSLPAKPRFPSCLENLEELATTWPRLTSLAPKAPPLDPRFGTLQTANHAEVVTRRKQQPVGLCHHLIRAEGRKERPRSPFLLGPSKKSWINSWWVLRSAVPRPTYPWETDFPTASAAPRTDSAAPGNPRPHGNPHRWPAAAPQRPWSWRSCANDKRHRCRGCP